MKREDIIIIYLTLQSLILSGLYCKVLRQAAYDEGILATYATFTNTDDAVGTCLVPLSKGGCKQ
jgi:hypothetical protein